MKRSTPKQVAENVDADQGASAGAPSVCPVVAPNLLAQLHASQATLHDNSILQQNNFPNASFSAPSTWNQPHINHLHLTTNAPDVFSQADPAIWLPVKIQELKKLATQEITRDTSILQGLSLYVPLEGANFAGADSGRDLEEHVIIDFLSEINKDKVLLIQGNSGAGKSLFAQYIRQKLWSNFVPGTYIPIFVSLPLLQRLHPHNLESQLLETVLQDRGFSSPQITYLQQTQVPLLLILDGYDETGIMSNLYQDNQLIEWNVKVIITCRTQYLTTNYQAQFKQLGANNRPIDSSFSELHIVPFAEAKLKEYICKFAKNLEYNKAGWSEERYIAELAHIQNWQELAKDPFTLSTLLTILPGLTSKTSQQSVRGQGMESGEGRGSSERIGSERTLTRAAIYDEFTRQWFEKEYFHLGNDLKAYIRAKQLTQVKVLNIFEKFAMDLAFLMFVTGKQIALRPVEEFRGGQAMAEDGAEERAGEWEALFVSDNEDIQQRLRIGLAGSPLRHLGNKQYAFMHKSYQEYFAALLIINDLLNKTGAERYQHLNAKLLNSEPAIIKFIADQLRSNEPRYRALKDTLFNIIEQSKVDLALRQTGSCAAANAITILNYAQTSFIDKDFGQTQLSCADLSGAILERCNFTHANLSYALLQGAWIRDCRFDDAMTEGMTNESVLKVKEP